MTQLDVQWMNKSKGECVEVDNGVESEVDEQKKW